MKRLLKKALSLNFLRKTLGYGNIFSALKFDLSASLAKLEYKNILVLSPHPDDDVFAMGGTIKKATTAGSRVTVAYFCDGSAGVSENRSIDIDSKVSGNLVERRKNEAKSAAKILGINECVFFGYRDSKLASGTSVFKAVTDLIQRVKPDIIFLPSFLDNHPDHRVVNEIFINLNNLPDDFPIWAYEVWTPLFPNRLIDISLYIKTKKEAILAHESQLQSRGYDKAIIGLNQYRAEINNISGFAEAFFAAPLKLYKELYRKS